LVASDVDPVLFAAHMADGVDKVGDGITLYESSRDRALDLSARILRRSRLGQILKRPLPPGVADYLRQHPDVVLVDVSEAEDIEVGNGHAYFRQSPWVSSDLLMTLRYRAAPGDRGLVRKEDGVIWTFPDSYERDVTGIIYRLNPALRAEVQSMGWNAEPN
jgi:esterase/lipase superfamily enzyme